MRNIFYVFILLSQAIEAQNLDITLFKDVCKHIVAENKLYHLKKEVPCVKLMYLEDANIISYDSCSNTQQLRLLKKYNRDEQLLMLKNEFMPIIPTKDTVFVVDSINFFIKDMFYQVGRFYFKLISKRSLENLKNRDVTYLYLKGSALRGNRLTLLVGFDEKSKVSVFEFAVNIKSIYSKVNLVNTKIPLE